MPMLPGDRVNRRVRARPWRRWVRACVGRTRAGIFTRLLRLAVAAATGVVTRAAASSGRIAAFVPPRPRGRHDLPRKCPRVRDHDQLATGNTRHPPPALDSQAANIAKEHSRTPGRDAQGIRPLALAGRHVVCMVAN
jgi:hypothetical protein